MTRTLAPARRSRRPGRTRRVMAATALAVAVSAGLVSCGVGGGGGSGVKLPPDPKVGSTAAPPSPRSRTTSRRCPGRGRPA
ncbi:hypothetical protein WKI68_26350 [Streptomyces sp. MS1.HAVA.3]|uniref:Lipoprotein n=1 Tax=Streptomyces caledonius TaxID=3134107 RepID=A0ABU8U9Y7_9ACTN